MRNPILRLLDWQEREKKKIKRKKEVLQSLKQQNSFPKGQSVRQEHGDTNSLDEHAGGFSAFPLAGRDGSAGHAGSHSAGVPPNQQLDQQVQPGA